jgi:hypothetical protein
MNIIKLPTNRLSIEFDFDEFSKVRDIIKSRFTGVFWDKSRPISLIRINGVKLIIDEDMAGYYIISMDELGDDIIRSIGGFGKSV